MSKEFEKFVAEHKKLSPALARYTKDAATKHAKVLSAAFLTGIGEATRHFEESLAQARRDGVTGTKLADFARNAHVSEALKAYQATIAEISKVQQEFQVFNNGVADAITAYDKLIAAIDKDLKSRSGRSESKTQIEGLRAALVDEKAKLVPVGKAYAAVPQAQREFVSKATQNLERLIAKPAGDQEAKLDNTMLPQMLVDRNRKKSLGRAQAEARAIKQACDDAIELAATDLPAARNAIKPAVDRLRELQSIRDEYVKAYDYESTRGLDGTKDYVAVTKVKTDIEKLYVNSERTLRGTVTTLRKA